MLVNRKVAQAMPTDGPCLIIAHSLGTIAGYNLLMDMPQRSRIKAYITFGSPLSNEAVWKRLPSDSPPRKAPCGVKTWLNARDRNDTVALYDPASEIFFGAPTIENYREVINDSENRHGIASYLADRYVTREIWEAIQ